MFELNRTSAASLIYCGKVIGFDFRVAGFVCRKIFGERRFCMGIRGDMRRPIQTINPYSPSTTDLVVFNFYLFFLYFEEYSKSI